MGYLGGFLQGVSGSLQQNQQQKRAQQQKLSDEQRMEQIKLRESAIDAINKSATNPKTGKEWAGTEKAQAIDTITQEISGYYTPGVAKSRLSGLMDKIRGQKPGVMNEQIPGVGGTPAMPSVPAMKLPASNVAGTQVPGPTIPSTPQAPLQRPPSALAQALAAGGPQGGLQQKFDEIEKVGKSSGWDQAHIDRAKDALMHIQEKPERGHWEMVPGTMNGQPVMLRHNTVDDSWTDQSGQSVDNLSGFTPTPKQAGPKVGTFGAFLTRAYGDNPTPEQYEEGRRLWAQSGAGTTVGTHVVMVPQKDGSIVPITIETTSTKSFGGVPSAKPSVGTTPGQAKQKAQSVAPKSGGVVAKGEAVGGRQTPEEVEASKAGMEAQSRLADSESANKVHNNPNDLIIVENYMQLAFGVQPRGIRGSPQWFEQIRQIAGGSLTQRMQGGLNRLAGEGLLSDDARAELMNTIREVVKNRTQMTPGGTKPSGPGKWNPQTGKYE